MNKNWPQTENDCLPWRFEFVEVVDAKQVPSALVSLSFLRYFSPSFGISFIRGVMTRTDKRQRETKKPNPPHRHDITVSVGVRGHGLGSKKTHGAPQTRSIGPVQYRVCAAEGCASRVCTGVECQELESRQNGTRAWPSKVSRSAVELSCCRAVQKKTKSKLFGNSLILQRANFPRVKISKRLQISEWTVLPTGRSRSSPQSQFAQPCICPSERQRLRFLETRLRGTERELQLPTFVCPLPRDLAAVRTLE